MNVEGILAAIIPIVTALEQLGIAYYIGGSVVSSIYGIPRATFDVDLIADLRPEHIRSFIKHLEADYYIDEDMIRDAIVHHSSFNVMYLCTGYLGHPFQKSPSRRRKITFPCLQTQEGWCTIRSRHQHTYAQMTIRSCNGEVFLLWLVF